MPEPPVAEQGNTTVSSWFAGFGETFAETLRLFVIRSEIPFVDGQSAGCAPPV